MDSQETPDIRLRKIIEQLVKKLREDYIISRGHGLITERERIYQEYYGVKYVPSSNQYRPVVFVDGGFHTLESDVLSLMIMSVGSCVRTEDGDLRYLGELGGHPFPEYMFIYARWIENKDGLNLFIQIIPIQESGLLLTDEKALKISERLTNLINNGFRKDVSRVKAIKLFKHMVKYIEGLIEIAYCFKTMDLLGSKTIGVIDGTLNRWFSVRNVRFYSFEGLDILSLLINRTKDQILTKLSSIYGLVKTTKFTSIARARWLFRDKNLAGVTGLYANTSIERAMVASILINERIWKIYGEEATIEIIHLFNRPTFPLSKVWVARFPITTNGDIIFHLDAYSYGPLIEPITGLGARPLSNIINEVSKRLDETVSDIMAHRTNIYGFPPFGFMEIDNRVRVSHSQLRKLEDLFISIIRQETGEVGHPLEYIFERTRKLRLGYGVL